MRRLIIGCLAAALGGCLPQGAATVVTVTPDAVPVEVAQSRAPQLDDNWVLVGRVVAMEHAELAAQASGELRRVEVREGQIVQEGDLIAEVDPALAEARVAVGRARVETLRMSLAGGEGVGDRLIGAEVREARAAVEVLSVELVRHEIRAPFAGSVARRHVDVGDHVSIGDPVVTLVSSGDVEVLVEAPPLALDLLEVGEQATLIGADVALAEIVAIVPMVDPATGLVRVRVRSRSPHGWLTAGATIGVRLPLGKLEEGVVVPAAALVRGDDGRFVVRIVEGRAVKVPVVLVGRADAVVLVHGHDLHEGDRVAVRGHERLRTGQTLELIDVVE